MVQKTGAGQVSRFKSIEWYVFYDYFRDSIVSATISKDRSAPHNSDRYDSFT
jgi:hypothetical protein